MKKKSVKSKLSKALGGNVDLNNKALNFKKSWDEVESLIKSEKHINKKN